MLLAIFGGLIVGARHHFVHGVHCHNKNAHLLNFYFPKLHLATKLKWWSNNTVGAIKYFTTQKPTSGQQQPNTREKLRKLGSISFHSSVSLAILLLCPQHSFSRPTLIPGFFVLDAYKEYRKVPKWHCTIL